MIEAAEEVLLGLYLSRRTEERPFVSIAAEESTVINRAFLLFSGSFKYGFVLLKLFTYQIYHEPGNYSTENVVSEGI